MQDDDAMAKEKRHMAAAHHISYSLIRQATALSKNNLRTLKHAHTMLSLRGIVYVRVHAYQYMRWI